MGMIGWFRRVPAPALEALFADPAPITALLEDEDPAVADDVIDVDKAWHGLHFLLTGEAWAGEPPLDFIVTGGAPIGDIDLGYGPARGFTPAEVRAIADALAPITEATLRARFDPAAMTAADIYPAIWDRPVEEDDTLGYLVENFTPLKAFIAETATRGFGLIAFCA